MAGIGFRLQNLLKKDSYTGWAGAYLYAAAIAVGPWLVAIVSLATISILAEYFVANKDVKLFAVIITYVYAGSLILTGGLQMCTTRYLADKIYVNEFRALSPCYHYVGVLTVIFGGFPVLLCCRLSGLSWISSAGAMIIFQSVTLTWWGMLFLSAARDYHSILRAFALGYVLSVVGSLAGAQLANLNGLLWGFASGQLLMAILLSIRLRVEFPSELTWSREVHGHWQRYRYLLAIGLFYNFGVWADKLVFWFGPHGKTLKGIFHFTPGYDTCAFLGYLTIIPATCLFLVRVETSFYHRYA